MVIPNGKPLAVMRSSTPERDDEDDVEHDEGGANTAAGDAAPETSYFYAEAGRPPLGPCTLPQLRVLKLTKGTGHDPCLEALLEDATLHQALFDSKIF